MTEGKRAPQVCLTCKSRKKSCDKTLPACNFCTKRNLVCKYPPSLSKVKYTESGAGKNFVVLHLPPSTVPHDVQQVEPLTIPKTQSSTFYRQSTPQAPSLDESIHQHVSSIIDLANLTFDDVSTRYFQNFHEWIHIVAPSLFYQRANYRAGIPSADFSVLVFVYFITMFKSGPEDSFLSQEALYTTSKSLFIQTQTAMCASIPLIQAAFIITAYEYYYGRPSAAYISLGSCINMARLLGIIGSIPLQNRIQADGNAKLELLEEANLSWGIVMLERIILCEIHKRHMRPSLEWPKPGYFLPSDLRQGNQLGTEDSNVVDSQATISTLLATDISPFGSQAQASSLLDKYLCITRSAADKQSTVVISELQQLDGEIRGFLSKAINADLRRERTRCPACAIAVRSLFLTHETILSLLSAHPTEAENQTIRSSMAALKTACNMVVDISKFHIDKEMLSGMNDMPICCFYNFEAAIKHLSEYNEKAGDRGVEQDINSMLVAKGKLWKWSMF